MRNESSVCVRVSGISGPRRMEVWGNRDVEQHSKGDKNSFCYLQTICSAQSGLPPNFLDTQSHRQSPMEFPCENENPGDEFNENFVFPRSDGWQREISSRWRTNSILSLREFSRITEQHKRSGGLVWNWKLHYDTHPERIFFYRYLIRI